MAEITNKNNSCDGCPFQDHSGAFTPGGAQATCRHPDAPRSSDPVPAQYSKDRRYDRYHWYHRRIGTGNPSPKWCPLRR